MKKITISVVFHQTGHAYVDVVPSNYNQWKPVQSSSINYNLDPGDYYVAYTTYTDGGGSIKVTEGDTELGSQQLAVGLDGGNILFTI
jgi:hypothetical protein